MSGAGQAGRDPDLAVQRAVHRALVGDLEQPLPLRLVERALEREHALDPVDPAFPRLALGAVGGVHLVVLELDADAP